MQDKASEIKAEPRRWFRFYAESVNDPKVQLLPAHLFKTWVNLLCVNSLYPDSTISDSDMAWRLRLTADEWKATKAEFVSGGLINEANEATYDGLGESALRLSAAEWAVIRSRVFARDDYTCRYCGERGKALECDHVMPVSRGGDHSDDNLVTACLPCNRAKRDKIVTIAEWSRVRRAAP